ncbi:MULTISPECIES: GNAT family N-acetyltransferase [unclassified Bacillus (in: firmicutes)]|uniref:GNAT family N-acetyltransferase n=1 Tax=unclassified Bacillus (in: firmicutes) TaxID=185979 RepID=UPI0008DFE8CE|nr:MULTISPECIES: GNAT family N-acetyltransferase [unclassified Bacillus (in: firmicutes)]SFA81546.1 Ribosomal protein S18 acetylase RimI [Bacillus sp. UNCCL13]SFQ71615.1 Ribosomal protein S18 acetylase RimI [Bacillus sp. cl95]
MKIETREAKVKDFHQMLEIYKELDEIHRLEHPDIFIEPEGDARPLEYIQNQIEDDDKYLVVAELDNLIVGFVECVVMESSTFPVMKKRKWVELNSLVVLKSFQSKGIGKMLLDCVVEWSNKKRINRIELKVFNFNTSAREFYSKAGFKNIYSKLYLDC